jgi:hypothetical protein
MSDKRYCGSGKLKETKYGEIIELLLFTRDIDEILKRQDEVKDSKYSAVKLVIRRRKEMSDKGQTHYGEIDTWEPPSRTEGPREDMPRERPAAPVRHERPSAPVQTKDYGDLPF